VELFEKFSRWRRTISLLCLIDTLSSYVKWRHTVFLIVFPVELSCFYLFFPIINYWKYLHKICTCYSKIRIDYISTCIIHFKCTSLLEDIISWHVGDGFLWPTLYSVQLSVGLLANYRKCYKRIRLKYLGKVKLGHLSLFGWWSGSTSGLRIGLRDTTARKSRKWQTAARLFSGVWGPIYGMLRHSKIHLILKKHSFDLRPSTPYCKIWTIRCYLFAEQTRHCVSSPHYADQVNRA